MRCGGKPGACAGFDQATDEMMQPVFYLPFMHSELLADQDRCVRLHEAFGDPELLKYATLHRDIVVKFGRFPHRNRAMAAIRRQPNRSFWAVAGSRGSALRIPSASRRDSARQFHGRCSRHAQNEVLSHDPGWRPTSRSKSVRGQSLDNGQGAEHGQGIAV